MVYPADAWGSSHQRGCHGVPEWRVNSDGGVGVRRYSRFVRWAAMSVWKREQAGDVLCAASSCHHNSVVRAGLRARPPESTRIEEAEPSAGANRILGLGFAVAFLCAHGFFAGGSAGSLAISTYSMAQDERERFLEWSASVGMGHSDAVRLLEHLPEDSALEPELPCWISSPSYCMAANDPAHGGMGIETQLIQEGFLIIGSCPNGDPVVVSFRDSSLPVFYLSHEELHRKPLAEVMRRISDSITAYDTALSTENSGIPLDYWGTKDG